MNLLLLKLCMLNTNCSEYLKQCNNRYIWGATEYVEYSLELEEEAINFCLNNYNPQIDMDTLLDNVSDAVKNNEMTMLEGRHLIDLVLSFPNNTQVILSKLENEDKNAVKVAIRIIWNSIKPSTAEAPTHDGQGNCNSGCGKTRTNNPRRYK